MSDIQEISKRIRQLRLDNHLEQTEVAEFMGYKSFTTISKWENGKNLPTGGKLVKLAQLFGTTTDYILHGTSSEINKETNPKTELIPSTLQKVADTASKLEHKRQLRVLDFANEQLEKQNKVVSLFDNHIENEELFPVKSTTFAAAARGLGHGFEADDHDTYTVYTDEEPPHHDYAIGIRGDSMLPKYVDGDMLYIIDKGVSSYNGQLCVVVHNGQTFFKKVYTEPDGLRLVSLNTKYDDIFIDYPPAEDTYIKIYDVVGSFTPKEM